MQKKVQVVMVVTMGSIANTISKSNNGGLTTVLTNTPGNSFHLYFTSNEEIKEGDLYINSQISEEIIIYNNGPTYTPDFNWVKKVIATTDKSLNLPLIPQSFVEEYVNSNGEIKYVELEVFSNGNVITSTNRHEVEDDTISVKKQTIEEAAEKLAIKYDSEIQTGNSFMDGFFAGAKAQKENNW